MRTHIYVLYLQGGVGSGKSRAFMAPVIEMLNEIQGLRILWGRWDFKDLKLSIMDKFFEILPHELINSKSEQYHFYNIGKARLYFNGLKDLGGLGSQEFGVIVVTEAYQLTIAVYHALKRRCRQENVINIILMEGEAPNESHWLNQIVNPTSRDYDPDVEMWRVSTRENWENLPLSYRGSLENMPKAAKRKYIEGETGFIPEGTPFYDGFDEALHKKHLVATVHKPLLRGWDYGWQHPAHVVAQLDAKGRLCILKEIMGSQTSIKIFGEGVKQTLNIYYPNYAGRDYGDPAGKQHSDKREDEKTSEDILRDLGFPVISKTSTYRDRKEIIERLLTTLIDGKPALMIDQSCRILIDGFLGGYHYPMLREGQEFRPVKTEIPFKDGYFEHLMNALEYIVINVFSPVKRSDADDKQAGYTFGRPKGSR